VANIGLGKIVWFNTNANEYLKWWFEFPRLFLGLNYEKKRKDKKIYEKIFPEIILDLY
jgi:hypothetical protein